MLSFKFSGNARKDAELLFNIERPQKQSQVLISRQNILFLSNISVYLNFHINNSRICFRFNLIYKSEIGKRSTDYIENNINLNSYNIHFKIINI